MTFFVEIFYENGTVVRYRVLGVDSSLISDDIGNPNVTHMLVRPWEAADALKNITFSEV